jgi:preprotein translocase subunit SecG
MINMISFGFVILIIVPVAMIGLVMMLNEASENRRKK